MSLFDDIQTAGLAAIRGLAGGPVTYQSATVTTNVTKAAMGQTAYEALDGDGFSVRATLTDFFIAVADLPAEPQPGDTIARGGLTYEVNALGSEPCWVYSDPNASEYRIHTKQRAA